MKSKLCLHIADIVHEEYIWTYFEYNNRYSNYWNFVGMPNFVHSLTRKHIISDFGHQTNCTEIKQKKYLSIHLVQTDIYFMIIVHFTSEVWHNVIHEVCFIWRLTYFVRKNKHRLKPSKSKHSLIFTTSTLWRMIIFSLIIFIRRYGKHVYSSSFPWWDFDELIRKLEDLLKICC